VSKQKLLPAIGFLLVGVVILIALAALLGAGRPSTEEQLSQHLTDSPSHAPTAIPPTSTPEPIVPTRTPTSVATAIKTPRPSAQAIETAKATATIRPIATPTATPPPPTLIATSIVVPPSTDLWRGRPRWGVGVATGSIEHYNVEPLRLGWYVNWNANLDPARPGGIEYAQTLRLKGGGLSADAGTIATIARANPGSLWLVGNEPDVKWQDNVEPVTYARLYHEAYTAVKAADPTAQVAIGGVAQPTPLRMRYLDAVLTAYKEQFGEQTPVDVWNVHAFVLREERGSWGVDIPPGLPDDHGMLYEIDDGDNMGIFRQQIVDFRRWMAERGYQNRPLIVSEYGILMPVDYGFPPERVVAFLKASFDFFLTAADPASGYPEDGYRLVQRWCWYSLNDVDHGYPTGRLFDPSTGQMTVVGQGWADYVRER
jgi:hypothetical protein